MNTVVRRQRALPEVRKGMLTGDVRQVLESELQREHAEVVGGAEDVQVHGKAHRQRARGAERRQPRGLAPPPH